MAEMRQPTALNGRGFGPGDPAPKTGVANPKPGNKSGNDNQY